MLPDLFGTLYLLSFLLSSLPDFLCSPFTS